MRTKKILAFVLAFVLMFPAGLANSSMTLEAQAEEYYEEYSYLDRDQMLPYESLYLGSVMNYYHENAEHPEGEWLEFPVNNVEITAQYDWGENGERIPVEEERFFLEKNPGEGWGIYTEEYGSADVQVSYEGKNGEETMEYTVYSVNEIYYLNWEFLNGCQFYLKNFEAPVDAVLTKNYRNDENGRNYYDYVVENFSIEFADESMEIFENDSLTAKIGEDQKSVAITTKDQEGDTWLEFRAYVHDNGEKYDVCMGGFSIAVAERFVNILPEAMENPELGETLDFSQVALYYHEGDDTEGQDITDNEDIRMYIDYYDGNAFEPTERLNDNQLPNFTRVSTDGGSICVVAEENVAPDGEEEQWELIRGRWFNFAGLDYNTWFEDLQNGDHGYVYSGEEQIIHINRENLEDKENYSLQFQVGINVNDEFVPLEDQDDLFEEVKEDGVITGIKLNGEALAVRKDELRDGGWFDIRVIVFVDGQEVSQDWRGMELREEWVDYHYNDWGRGLLPYWDHGISKNFGYELNNAENPDGHWGELQYTDIRVEVVEGNDNMLELSEWDDGNGWNLHANDYGHAIITLTHPSATNPEEEVEHSFDIWVGQDVWNMETTMSMGTNDIRPGESMDVRVELTRECYDEENGHYRGNTDQVAYRWGYNEGAPEDLVTVEEDGSTLHITANADAEDGRDTWIWVRAYMTDEDGNILIDEDGNEIEVAYSDFQIGIRDCYYTILPVEMDHTVELGETVNLTPRLMFVSEEGVQAVEDAVFKCEWDPSELEISLENGQVLEPEEDGRSPFGAGTFKVKKLKNWNVGAGIFAFVKNEAGDYEEVFQRWLDTGDTSYDAWFEDNRGEDWFTFVFEYETGYKIPFNVDSMRTEGGSLKDNITLEWTVGQFNDEGELVKELTEGVEYTLNEEKTEITLNGKKLKEGGYEDQLAAQVVVKSNGMMTTEDPYELKFYVQHDQMQLEDEGIMDTLPLPGWGWYYPENSIWVYVQNSDYPNGENLQFEVRNIETNPLDDGEDEVFEIIHEEDGTWIIEPLRCGEAEVIYTLYHESVGEVEVRRNKIVAEEIYSMGLLSSTHCWDMLTNDELQMMIDVYQYTLTEDGNADVQVVPSERYNLRFDYNQDLITIDETGKVTSHDWYDYTGVYVEAEIQMLDGENTYVIGNGLQIFVNPAYQKLHAEPLYMEPEEVVNVDDLDISLVRISEENREGDYLNLDGYQLHPSELMEISEDGKTMRFAAEYAEESLPFVFAIEYEGYFEDWSSWDYFDVIVCRHEMSEWDVEKEPTNVEDGLETRTCRHCGMVEERVLESPNLKVTEVFKDVKEGEWYVDSVQYTYDKGILVGDGDTYAPLGNTTRAMVSVILYRMEGSPEVTDYTKYDAMKDLAGTRLWYTDAIAWALNEKVSTGDDYNMLYNPNANVTREQLALFLWRYAEYTDKDVTVTSTYKELFGDTFVNEWAKEGFAWAVEKGIIRGAEEKDSAGNIYYVLNPQGGATRAQLARMLHRYLGGTNE